MEKVIENYFPTIDPSLPIKQELVCSSNGIFTHRRLPLNVLNNTLINGHFACNLSWLLSKYSASAQLPNCMTSNHYSHRITMVQSIHKSVYCSFTSTKLLNSMEPIAVELINVSFLYAHIVSNKQLSPFQLFIPASFIVLILILLFKCKWRNFLLTQSVSQWLKARELNGIPNSTHISYIYG